MQCSRVVALLGGAVQCGGCTGWCRCYIGVVGDTGKVGLGNKFTGSNKLIFSHDLEGTKVRGIRGEYMFFFSFRGGEGDFIQPWEGRAG